MEFGFGIDQSTYIFNHYFKVEEKRPSVCNVDPPQSSPLLHHLELPPSFVSDSFEGTVPYLLFCINLVLKSTTVDAMTIRVNNFTPELVQKLHLSTSKHSFLTHLVSESF
jgi:hypothetical protein